MDQDILRRLIEAKLADGRLPHDNIPRVWGGPSDGDTCNACDEVITKAHLVMEGISTEGAVCGCTFNASTSGTRCGRWRCATQNSRMSRS